MYAQLGTITFNGRFGFTSYSVSGDEAKYAEVEVFNSPIILQRTGDGLDEISITINLHARDQNPKKFLNQLKSYKDDGEILPLLLGNGQFLGNYVIVSFPYEVTKTFEDGTFEALTINLALREYVALNKQEKQQQAYKKSAIAVGDVQQVIIRPLPPVSPSEALARSTTRVNMQAAKADGLVGQYENNQSMKYINGKWIKECCDKINGYLDEVSTGLDNAKEKGEKVTAIRDAAARVRSAADNVKASIPPKKVDDLRNANTALQGAVRVLKRTTAPLMAAVILRQEF